MRKDAGRDLGLEALARIQAMEAEVLADEFREEWLEGERLESWSEAVTWIRSMAVAEAPSTLQPTFEVPRLPAITSADHSDPQRRRQWLDEWLDANPETSPRILMHEGPQYAVFELLSEDGALIDRQYIQPESALESLQGLCEKLSDLYGWSRHQGQMFILLGTIPVLEPIRVQIRTTRQLGTASRLAAGPNSTEIVLTVRPQATQQSVANAYEAARTEMLTGIFELPAGLRNKPITSTRTRDLAILGGRIVRGDFKTWDEARASYMHEFPEEEFHYAENMGRFRRDCKAAFLKVTGLKLDWQPQKRKRASVPIEVIEQDDGNGPRSER